MRLFILLIAFIALIALLVILPAWILMLVVNALATSFGSTFSITLWQAILLMILKQFCTLNVNTISESTQNKIREYIKSLKNE